MEGDLLFEDFSVFCLRWSFSQRLSLQPQLALLIPLESLLLTVFGLREPSLKWGQILHGRY